MTPLRRYIRQLPEPRRWRIRDVVAETIVCVFIFALPYAFLVIFGGQ